MSGPLVLALGPAARDHRRVAAGEKLCAMLMGLLARRVRLEVTNSYDDLLTLVGSNEAHLAWLPPALYVTGRTRYGLRLLVGGIRADQPLFRGALFVRSDSGVHSIADLQGRRAVWVDRSSCSGYLFPRLALRDAGFPPERLFREEIFVGDHGSVVRAVALGQADVGATYVRESNRDSYEDSGWAHEVDPKVMRVIITSTPIPADVITAAPSIEHRFAQELTAYLSEIHSTPAGARAIQSVFDVERFAPVDPQSYEQVAAALRAESGERD